MDRARRLRGGRRPGHAAWGRVASTAAPRAWLTILAALEGRDDYDERLGDLEDLVGARPPVGILARPVRDLTHWAKGMRALVAGDGTGAVHHLGAIDLRRCGR